MSKSHKLHKQRFIIEKKPNFVGNNDLNEGCKYKVSGLCNHPDAGRDGYDCLKCPEGNWNPYDGWKEK